LFKSKSVVTMLAATAMLLAAPYAVAESKLGYINLQRVSNEAPQAQRAMKKIKAEFEKRDQDLQKLGKQLQAMQEKLEKEGMTMADAERRSREKEFGELNREFQRKQREFREDLSVRQNEELASLYDSVNKVIRRIAEIEKYDLIVQEAVYYSPNIDITGKVIKALADGATASAPSAATSASAR
jgi:outer membrane protein